LRTRLDTQGIHCNRPPETTMNPTKDRREADAPEDILRDGEKLRVPSSRWTPCSAGSRRRPISIVCRPFVNLCDKRMPRPRWVGARSTSWLTYLSVTRSAISVIAQALWRVQDSPWRFVRPHQIDRYRL